MPHIHEKIDFCVEVFVVHKNKVLLRMHDKHHFWLSVGGHIELNEGPIEAAIREVKEEVGLDIKIAGEAPSFNTEDSSSILAPRYLWRHKVNEKHEHIVFVYFATSDTDVIKDPNYDHEKSETRWVTKEELKKMDLRPNILFYAEEALKELSQ